MSGITTLTWTRRAATVALLPVLFALVGLVALTVTQLPTQAAQFGVWSATMTAEVSPGGGEDIGFGDDSGSAMDFGSLTKNTFTFEGTTYTITRLAYDQYENFLEFQVDPDLPSSLVDTSTLTLGELSFVVASAIARPAAIYRWTKAGLTFPVGAQVSASLVRLVEPPAQPANFDATIGDGPVTLSWDDPADSTITGYEIFRHGLEQKLVASDRAESDKFGYSVAVDGDTLVVGAYRVDDGQGAAYVFSRQSDGAWSQVAKLTAFERNVDDQFGQSVSIDGEVIVVGAVGDDDVADGAGAAYVFKQPTAGWSDMNETKKLTATDGGKGDQLGWAVDIDDNTTVVSALRHDAGEMKDVLDAGAVYVFAKPVDGAWAEATQVARLASSEPEGDDQLGTSVAVSGDVVVAGAPVGRVVLQSDYGAALVFVKPATGWTDDTENGVLTASDPSGADGFGVSVDIDSDTIAVGAFRHTAAASNSGAGYVFVKPDSGWASATESAKLTASDAAQKDGLGSSIAIHGETILIGAFEDRNFSQGPGKAYVYTASAGGWADAAEMAKLTAVVRADGDNFGISVALDVSAILARLYA